MGPIQLDLSDVEIVDEVIALDDRDIAVLEPKRRGRLPTPRRAPRAEPIERARPIARVRQAAAFDDEPTRVYAMRRIARR